MAPRKTIDREKVVRLYQEDEERTASSVAEMMGITVSSVTRILRDAGVEVRVFRNGGPRPRSFCSACGLVPPEHHGKCDGCYRTHMRDYHIRKKYGIGPEEFDQMVERQGGRCALCQREPERLVVDHCHETGVIRGLLCRACNVCLGRFGDNVAGVRRVIEYLERTAANG